MSHDCILFGARLVLCSQATDTKDLIDADCVSAVRLEKLVVGSRIGRYLSVVVCSSRN